MDKTLLADIHKELTRDILPYWEKNARDVATRGFYGAITNQNKGSTKEWRGVAMAAHILWTYSAAARLLHAAAYLRMADYAYRFIMHSFYDPFNGGMCWSVKANGDPLLPRKQVAGNAACVQAFSEYAAANAELRKQHTPAIIIMDHALSVFNLLERFAYDANEGGYAESLNADWTSAAESEEPPPDGYEKTLYTNLRVLEAYTNLYRTMPVVYPERRTERRTVGMALKNIVRLHLGAILGADYHMKLAFDADWTSAGPDAVSFGDDIAASWLLWEAACELKDLELKREVRPAAIKVAQLALVEGLDRETGGFETGVDEDGVRDTTRLWKNQAEALVGFYNAWEMTGDKAFLAALEQLWRWIQEHQKDTENGEWFWAVSREGKPSRREQKGGNGKTCFHNARACMELLRRGGASGGR